MTAASNGGERARALSVATGAATLVFAAPLAYLAVRGTAAGGPELWGQRDTLAPLARSLALATAAAAATGLLGTSLAWLVGRTQLPGARLWQALLPLPLVIPSFIGAFALVAALAPGGLVPRLLAALGLRAATRVEGFWGALYVLTLLTYPYVYLPVVARLRQLPPSLEESARLLGRRPVRIFATVVLPQVRGAVAAGMLLVFLYAISDFGAVQLLRYDTLTRAIYAARVYEPTRALSLSLLLGVLALAVVAAERGAAARTPATGVQSGAAALRLPLGRWRLPSVAAVAGVVGLALVGPLAVLAYWAARGLGEGSSRAGAIAADPSLLLLPALRTALVSLAAAGVAVAVVLPVAYLTVRRRRRIGAMANAVVVASFALPGLVVALALVSAVLQLPVPVAAAIYQTTAILVVAYVVHFGAQALRAAQVAVAAVPAGVEDAARLLGAGRLRRLWAIELPLLRPGLLAGGGLVLLSAMKELPATLLLAPAGFQTLATRIWDATEDAFLADASIASLVLVALSAVLTWLLVLRPARRGDGAP